MLANRHYCNISLELKVVIQQTAQGPALLTKEQFLAIHNFRNGFSDRCLSPFQKLIKHLSTKFEQRFDFIITLVKGNPIWEWNGPSFMQT